MTSSELRSIALVVKHRVTALREAVSPAFNEVEAWTLNSNDASLPTIAKVKAVLLAFEQIDKPSLLLYDEIRAVKTASDAAATLPDSLGITWEDILGKPSVALTGHLHVKADVTDFPTRFITIVHVGYVGNGETSRIIPFSGGVLPKLILFNTSNGAVIRWPGNEIPNCTTEAFTVESVYLNASGLYYTSTILG